MYEKEKQELVENYGFNKEIAKDLLASRNNQEIEIVMNFLRRYGNIITVK